MSSIKTPIVVGVIVLGTSLGFAPAASATIHPIVESYDCANAQATAHHPLGDVADPPGVTPGYGNHSENSDLASLSATSKGFTDFSSPAWFGFKLDGTCGQVGQ
ncbi:UNVERIFIED_ORG: hypothetical protein ABIB52_000578 [Arthrobacter sp. UYCu721]